MKTTDVLEKMIRRIIKEELKLFTASIIREIRNNTDTPNIIKEQQTNPIRYNIPQEPNIRPNINSLTSGNTLDFLKEFVDPESIRKQSEGYVDPGIDIDDIPNASVANAVKRDYREFMSKMK